MRASGPLLGRPWGAAFYGSWWLAPDGPAALNRRRGRLAQLVRASRLHREGRRFESVTAYQTNRTRRCDPDRTGSVTGSPAGITPRYRLSRVTRARPRLARLSMQRLSS